MTGLLVSLEMSVNSLNLCDIYLGTTGEQMYVSFGNGDSVTSKSVFRCSPNSPKVPGTPTNIGVKKDIQNASNRA